MDFKPNPATEREVIEADRAMLDQLLEFVGDMPMSIGDMVDEDVYIRWVKARAKKDGEFAAWATRREVYRR